MYFINWSLLGHLYEFICFGILLACSIQNSKYNVMAFLGEEIPADEK